MKIKMTFEICFGAHNTGYYVDYINDVLVDDILEQMSYHRKYYPDEKMWLRLHKVEEIT